MTHPIAITDLPYDPSTGKCLGTWRVKLRGFDVGSFRTIQFRNGVAEGVPGLRLRQLVAAMGAGVEWAVREDGPGMLGDVPAGIRKKREQLAELGADMPAEAAAALRLAHAGVDEMALKEHHENKSLAAWLSVQTDGVVRDLGIVMGLGASLGGGSIDPNDRAATEAAIMALAKNVTEPAEEEPTAGPESPADSDTPEGEGPEASGPEPGAAETEGGQGGRAEDDLPPADFVEVEDPSLLDLTVAERALDFATEEEGRDLAVQLFEREQIEEVCTNAPFANLRALAAACGVTGRSREDLVSGLMATMTAVATDPEGNDED